MKLDPILAKASKFARSGKYEAAIRLLEPEVNRYHGSYSYYYLLGASCLYSGDYGGALTYLRLAHDVKRRDPLAVLGLAALYLRRSETDRAVDYYLEALEVAPKNRTAKKAMKLIRKHAGKDSFSAWLEAGKLPSVYPSIPFPGFSAKSKLACVAILAVACALAFGLLIRFKAINDPFKPKGERQPVAELSLSREDRADPLQTGGSYRYVLTKTQALDVYDKAHSLFTLHRDEASRVHLNRILESNASEGLKNKAQIIISYMEAPGFDSFKRGDNIAYNDAIREPWLYSGVYVIWRGMATNVKTTDEGTAFDFLVGYDTKKTLEGFVYVSFAQAVSVNTERPLEVLGRIVLSGDGGLPGGPIRLEGIAIYQSGLLLNE
jgi:hypothetical protein